MTTEPTARPRQTRRGLQLQRLGAVAGLVVLIIGFAVSSPPFLQVNNLLNIATQTSVIAIIAIGQTYVIITGGIDLSVGAIAALAGVLTADLLRAEVPIPLAILVGLLGGTFVGALNGVLIAYGKIPPFIATLGMLGIARGAVLVMTNGSPVSGLPRAFSWLGNGSVLGIPFPAVLMLVLCAVVGWVLLKSRFGRGVFAIGSNEKTAFLSGLHVPRIKIGVYAVSGLLSAIAGVILTSRLVSAAPTAGEGYELDSIAATVIGGASLSGGVGGIGGTLIGALVMGVLRNGLNLLGVSYYWQQIAIGVVIIAAVWLDALRRRRTR
ncbi:monosaccharide ABC transporter membrane protein (CUT2 family) [Salana multivorans]|uniref:Monosaccharide ABC transporter membrane protein (CUT2 family) n=1 Tax=Salana multivorans TaxID=120377 RepID=A0A3N2D9U1_9MICO|nr:ABC transporter permease [Salana multivorans]ROR96224.1 monosaccharide ABC transporter membrane protein (CUT2 family) [Salana multivorans]